MHRLRRFFRNHKTFVLSIGFLAVFSFTVSFAAPLYTPGQTLDPACIPGSLNCTVSTGGGGTSQWTTNGSDIYFNTGKVGIGTTTPSDPLEVNGEIKANNINIIGAGTTVTVSAPTGLTGSIVYNGLYNYFANNYTTNYRVYAYKDNPTGGRIYSSSYVTLSAPLTDDFSDNLYGITLSWNPVSGADGYRILIDSTASNVDNPPIGSSPAYTAGYVDGYDTNSTSIIDDGGGNVFFDPSSDTVTPNSYTSFSNTNNLNGTTILNGSIGINTNTPQTDLDLENGGSVLAVGTFGAGALVPDLGASTRLEWIPSASAFRAGTALTTEWDSVNVGQYSTAFGDSTTASGSVATAFGVGTSASGFASTTFGSQTISSGQYSSAFNHLTTATGDASVAFGVNTTATAFNSAVFGSINVGGGNTTTWVATDPLLEVGNSRSINTPSDALMILKNGAVGIDLGSAKPSFALQVGSATVGGIVARFQNSAGTCDINPTTSSLTCSSDMNLKKNINNLSDNSTWSFNNNITFDNQSVLDKIMSLNPVNYNWNTEQNNDPKHAGFIAQEVRQVFPDLVIQDPTTQLLSLNYTGLIPYTVAAIKEMNLNLTSIDDLTRTNSWRDALVNWFADAANGIGSLVVQNKICVDDQCLTKSDIQQLLQLEKQNGGNTPVITSSDDTSTGGDDTQSSDVVPVTIESPDVTPLVVPDPSLDSDTDQTPEVTPNQPTAIPTDPSTDPVAPAQ